MSDETDRLEGDAGANSVAVSDNSLGRLLTLSDGVFAIAMTLFALDLKVPDVSGHVSNGVLRHALAHQSGTYFSFVISFYVVAGYWSRHRKVMRTVKSVQPHVVGANLMLLLIIAGLPFPAALLGTHASDSISLVVYGGANLLAVLALLRLHYLTRDERHRSGDDPSDEVHSLMATGVVFILAIPSGFVFPGHGVYVLLLLALVQPAFALIRHRADW